VNASLLLLIATLALVVGPALERLGRRVAGLAAVVDGATVGGIVIVSLLHLMPESAAHLGWWAPVLLLVGLALPVAAEKLLVGSWQGWRVSVGALVVVLFVAHLLAEGAALANTATDERLALATVLVVAGHNLPLGVLLWGTTKHRFGVAWSVAVLLAVAAITWVPLLVPVSQGNNFTAACSALLAGGLLHLVLQHEPVLAANEDRRWRNLWASLGAVGAAALLLVYLGASESTGAHAHGGSALPKRFLELFLETAPPLLLGVLGAALIEAFLPVTAARWLGKGHPFAQALRGVFLGAPMPVCSCGVLPIYRSLILKGVPATAALALLVAAPEIGVDSILLSLPMLGTATTLARLISALVLALTVAWIVGRFAKPRAVLTIHAHDLQAPKLRAWQAIQRGLFETWGHLAPWILVGLFATVFVEPWLSADWARSMHPWVQILALSLIGMPTYICATAATPLAALLLVGGFSPGAVIAFLLTGPATNFTTFGALRKLHSTHLAILFVLTALAVTFAIGVCVNLILPELGAVRAGGVGEEEHGLLHYVCAAILCAMTLWVLLREGPRPFLAQLNPGAEDHEHAAPPPPVAAT
jgi:uncharacterized protein